MGWPPCGLGTSSLVALVGGWVNKTSLIVGNNPMNIGVQEQLFEDNTSIKVMM